MTAWLPIETYPYDGRWGLFRGGEVIHPLMYLTEDIDQPPVVIARNDNPEYSFELAGTVESGLVSEYDEPTEWLPLEKTLDDLVDDAYVNGLRIAL